MLSNDNTPQNTNYELQLTNADHTLADAKPWSNLAKVVYKRTYARKDSGTVETWEKTVERVIRGNIRGHDVTNNEAMELEYFMRTRKACPAGRGLWFSGAPSHERLGGAALNNCWYVNGDNWENLVIAQDLLMLGGGVGMSVEHKYVSKMPKVKSNVKVVHHYTKDADFIVPDSREGWGQLTYKMFEAFFVTGKSFSWSSVCIRGAGELIQGFGGTASGPIPLMVMIEKISDILNARVGKHIRPIDMADLLCCIAEMVVAGNVRRSALMILGDVFDKEFLKAKRWDLGTLPTQRSNANFSVVCDDTEDLSPLFWKTYEIGEPFGIFNRKNARKFGRMGELMHDEVEGCNPCAEAMLINGEPCNLQELAAHLMANLKEMKRGGELMHRYGKRVTCERYHHGISQAAIEKNRRVGTGITGFLISPLCNPKDLDTVYRAIVAEGKRYSKYLGIPDSIRHTVMKPSGTMGKVMDAEGYEGIHAAFAEWMIQRVRFASTDPALPILKAAGHYMEPVVKLDGSLDMTTMVVDFYIQAPAGAPIAGKDWTLQKQLDAVLMAQKYWADQSVSVTIYYRKEEIPFIKEWLCKNLSNLKTISFLCQNDHGFKQAPKEAITEEQFIRLSSKIKPIDIDSVQGEGEISSQECAGGVCPVK